MAQSSGMVYSQFIISHYQKYRCPTEILHKHCFQFWRDKQRVLFDSGLFFIVAYYSKYRRLHCFIINKS